MFNTNFRIFMSSDEIVFSERLNTELIDNTPKAIDTKDHSNTKSKMLNFP